MEMALNIYNLSNVDLQSFLSSFYFLSHWDKKKKIELKSNVVQNRFDNKIGFWQNFDENKSIVNRIVLNHKLNWIAN